MPCPAEPSEADLAALRRVLNFLTADLEEDHPRRVWGKQSALAAAMEVANSTVNQWLREKRGPQWHHVVRAVVVTVEQLPSLESLVVSAFVRHVLGREGEWRPGASAACAERTVVSRALQLADEAGAVVGLLRRALDDGHLDPNEAASGIDAADRLQRTLAELRAQLAQVAK